MKIDIEEIVNLKIKDMEEKKIVEKVVEDTLEKTILESIEDALNSRKVKSIITERLEREVSYVASQVGLTAYNKFIADKVKIITEDVCYKDVAEKIQTAFNEILIMKKEGLSLSDICDKYRSYISYIVNEEEKRKLKNFYVDVEKREDPFNWIRFQFSKEYIDYHIAQIGQIEFMVYKNLKDNTGVIGNVYIDGHNIKNCIKLGYIYEFERLIVNLAYNETPVIIDVENKEDIDNSFIFEV